MGDSQRRDTYGLRSSSGRACRQRRQLCPEAGHLSQVRGRHGYWLCQVALPVVLLSPPAAAAACCLLRLLCVCSCVFFDFRVYATPPKAVFAHIVAWIMSDTS